MRLSALRVDGLRVEGEGDPPVAGISCDSRSLRPGEIFAAIGGTRSDGMAFVPEALARGAVAILCEQRAAVADPGVPVLRAEQPRLALARLAALLAGPQPECVVAVTGTNGKSSIVSFTRQLWLRQGLPAGSIGTLGVSAPDLERPLALTTPGPVELHGLLAELARRGVTHVAMEASSHALAQHRLDAVHLRAAAFSHLSRDHFDYHGDLEAYFGAKARLFSAILPGGGKAVLNRDVAEFAPLAKLCLGRGIAIIDYGRGADRLRLRAVRAIDGGLALEVEIDGLSWSFSSPLIGAFQAHNLLAAAGLALATGLAGQSLAAALPHVSGARGRMELVGRHPRGAAVFVDYAHTPDALARVLEALRPHCSGRLSVVFGAGGERDAGKRALMGAVSARLADRCIVTDDNPRNEAPSAIRQAVLLGCPGADEIGDRREAIAAALDQLGPGDVLVVAGKGHETVQTMGGQTLPFDDAAVIRALLADRGRERAA